MLKQKEMRLKKLDGKEKNQYLLVWIILGLVIISLIGLVSADEYWDETYSRINLA